MPSQVAAVANSLKRTLRQVPAVLLLVFLLCCVLFAAAYYVLLQVNEQRRLERESSEVMVTSHDMAGQLYFAVADLLLAADDPDNRMYIKPGRRLGQLQAGEKIRWFCRHKKEYYRYRILDLKGMEVLDYQGE